MLILMSAVETGQMSAAETGQMSAVETRQMCGIQTGLRPVSIVDICLGSTADICHVSAADICPVSTADISISIHHSASAFSVNNQHIIEAATGADLTEFEAGRGGCDSSQPQGEVRLIPFRPSDL